MLAGNAGRAGLRGGQRLDQHMGRGVVNGTLWRLQELGLRPRDGFLRHAGIDPGK